MTEKNEFEKAAAKAEEVGEAFMDKAAEIGEQVEEKIHGIEKLSPKEVGDLAVKFATDTAYAAAGFANLIAEKAREFAEKQKATLAETPGSGETADKTKEFLDQVTTQLNKFLEDLGHTYKDLAERGREAVNKMQAQVAARAEAPKGDDAPGPFDMADDADAVENTGEIVTEGLSDAEPADGTTEFELDADAAAEAPIESDKTRDWGEDNR